MCIITVGVILMGPRPNARSEESSAFGKIRHLAKFGIWQNFGIWGWHLAFGIRRPGIKERLGTVVGQLAPCF